MAAAGQQMRMQARSFRAQQQRRGSGPVQLPIRSNWQSAAIIWWEGRHHLQSLGGELAQGLLERGLKSLEKRGRVSQAAREAVESRRRGSGGAPRSPRAERLRNRPSRAGAWAGRVPVP